jgi:hypothetical protein
MRQESIESLRKRYRGEWLLIGNVELDEMQRPIKGVLLAHSKRKAEIYSKLLKIKTDRFAIEYAGKIPKDYAVMFNEEAINNRP